MYHVGRNVAGNKLFAATPQISYERNAQNMRDQPVYDQLGHLHIGAVHGTATDGRYRLQPKLTGAGTQQMHANYAANDPRGRMVHIAGP